MIENKETSLLARFRRNLITGLLVAAPVFITLSLAWLIIKFVDGIIRGILPNRYEPAFLLNIPGLGILIAGMLLVFIGSMTKGMMGRWLIAANDKALNRIPILRNIYAAVKQIFETVLSSKSDAFREVVLVEYPRKNVWAMGFITGVTKGEVQAAINDEIVNVFLPTTPNPTSGFLLFLPRSEIVVLKMSVEEGIKMVISGGIVTPPIPKKDSITHQGATPGEPAPQGNHQ